MLCETFALSCATAVVRQRAARHRVDVDECAGFQTLVGRRTVSAAADSVHAAVAVSLAEPTDVAFCRRVF